MPSSLKAQLDRLVSTPFPPNVEVTHCFAKKKEARAHCSYVQQLNNNRGVEYAAVDRGRNDAAGRPDWVRLHVCTRSEQAAEDREDHPNEGFEVPVVGANGDLTGSLFHSIQADAFLKLKVGSLI